ncbi:aminoglycoside phosphotransferase family protein [Neobacillus niacini]|uniref:aminoglycoside phosphotransferase family protein n=1 Tax=Neobacillus niacini TaxID=86668 RepID=UPI0005F006D4|nr:aminoglycoside phosphotransferase family protein [Neobacillus niacini]
MSNETQLPAIEDIISAYQDCYGTSRQVLQAVLISYTPKIRKMILEYLVTFRNQDGELEEESLIGKVYSDQKKGIESYRFLQYLWNNGLGSDPQYTIVHPIAYLQKWRLMIMSKSPGKTLDDWIHDPNMNSKQLAFLISEWLTRMHEIPLTEIREATRTRANADMRRFYEDLTERIPKEKSRLKSIYDKFIKNSEKNRTDETVLLHGDFHTKNVFLHEENVIAIDFDHHFAGDPAWDVAYLACQIQVSGFFKKGNFDFFQPMIKYFIEKYFDAHPAYDKQSFLDRISLYSARSLFESLHYELCVLNTGKFTIIDPFLTKCELYLQGKGYK